MTKDLDTVTNMYRYLDDNKDKHTPEELSNHANTHPENRDAVFASGRFDYAAINEELRAEAIETSGRKNLLYDDLTLNDCIDFVIDQIFAGDFSYDDAVRAVNMHDGDFLFKLMNEAKYIDPDLNGMILEDVDSDIVNSLRK